MTYQYDAKGRLISVERPDGTVTAYTYDDQGNRLTGGGINTPAGSNVEVQPAPGTSITFGQVSSPGQTTVTVEPAPPATPQGYNVLGQCYDVSTTATCSGPVKTCFTYSDAGLSPSQEANVKVLHWEGSWVDRTCSLDTAANQVCGCVSQLSPFVVAVPAATQVLQAALTVKPLPLDLATSKKRFTCLIDLPSGYSEAQVNQASLQLSLPDCPECGVSSSPAGTLQGSQYVAKFKRALLRKVAFGDVPIKVTGQLQDGTPFEGTTTVQTWKPLTLTDIHTENAKGQAETQFGRNEPVVLAGSYVLDARAGKGLKVSLLIKAFGQTFKTPWQPVASGPNPVGYSVLVPGNAALGNQNMKATLRLQKNGQLDDTAGATLPIEVLEQPKPEW